MQLIEPQSVHSFRFPIDWSTQCHALIQERKRPVAELVNIRRRFLGWQKRKGLECFAGAEV